MPRYCWVIAAPNGGGGGRRNDRPWMRGAANVTFVFAASVVILSGQSVGAAPTLECSVDIECSTRDAFAICDASHSICVCTQGRYREPPYKIIKCAVGKSYNEKCRSSRECLLADQYSDCIGGVCRCPPSYIPIPIVNNNTLSLFRCMLDPFYVNGDHANLTFFKVSPVPLLVICIILVYLGYQRGAKVPQRRGSSTSSNRRIVPMWRGVTFHQTTPLNNNNNGITSSSISSQNAVTPPRNSTSGSSGGGQTILAESSGGGIAVSGAQRRESSGGPVVVSSDSRRGRGSSHSRRDSGPRDRPDRLASHLNNAGTVLQNVGVSSGQLIPQMHQASERRNSAMSPPPPYAEEAPPSYEDAIRASRVAIQLQESDGRVSHNNATDPYTMSSIANEYPETLTAATGRLNNTPPSHRDNPSINLSAEQRTTTSSAYNTMATATILNNADSETQSDAALLIKTPLYLQACKRSSK